MSGERSGERTGDTLTRWNRGGRGGRGEERTLTRHLGFGPLVVNGLAGERVDADLGDGHGGVLQLAVEPQHLSPFAGVLHHLEPRWPTGNSQRRCALQPGRLTGGGGGKPDTTSSSGASFMLMEPPSCLGECVKRRPLLASVPADPFIRGSGRVKINFILRFFVKKKKKRCLNPTRQQEKRSFCKHLVM